MPARCAASIFSLRPPIGSTRPRSVISPVIATSRRTGIAQQRRDERRCHRDARGRAVLGDGALGEVDVDVDLAVEVALAARAAARASARSSSPPAPTPACTSPSWPVITSLPLPGTTVTSVGSRSPPSMVTARPLARPISSLLLARARAEACGTPRYLASRLARRPCTGSSLAGRSTSLLARSCGRRVRDLALEGADAGLLACSGG